MRASGVATIEANGQHVAVVTHSSSFDLIYGSEVMTSVNLEPATLMRIARFAFVWWVFSAWCGLRPRFRRMRAIRQLNAKRGKITSKYNTYV